MSTIYVMEAANLFAGDHRPTASKHLESRGVEAAALQEMYQKHMPGVPTSRSRWRSASRSSNRTSSSMAGIPIS